MPLQLQHHTADIFPLPHYKQIHMKPIPKNRNNF